MNSLNKVILMGRLGRDPELKTVNNSSLCKFSLAVDEGYGDNKTTNWINITAWNKLADVCAKVLKKGRQVVVEGRLKVRSYDDKDGVKRHITEVVIDEMLAIGKSEHSSTENNQEQQPEQEENV